MKEGPACTNRVEVGSLHTRAFYDTPVELKGSVDIDGRLQCVFQQLEHGVVSQKH